MRMRCFPSPLTPIRGTAELFQGDMRYRSDKRCGLIIDTARVKERSSSRKGACTPPRAVLLRIIYTPPLHTGERPDCFVRAIYCDRQLISTHTCSIPRRWVKPETYRDAPPPKNHTYNGPSSYTQTKIITASETKLDSSKNNTRNDLDISRARKNTTRGYPST